MQSPTIREAEAFTIGATVEAVHAETVTDEVLGLSEGVPGQSFHVSRPPVVPGDEAGDGLVVEAGHGTAEGEFLGAVLGPAARRDGRQPGQSARHDRQIADGSSRRSHCPGRSG
ncbi:hypothetical protein ACWD4O_45090 [Streptomyces sp. NPDC002623]